MSSNIVILNLLKIPEELFIFMGLIIGLKLELSILKLGSMGLVQMVESLLLADLLKPVKVVYLLLQFVSPHFFNSFLGMIFRDHAFVGNDC